MIKSDNNEFYWNHRVVRTFYGKEASYSIHEAYYEGDVKEHKKISLTKSPIAPIGETLKELKETLTLMTKALQHPVLDYKTKKEIKP